MRPRGAVGVLGWIYIAPKLQNWHTFVVDGLMGCIEGKRKEGCVRLDMLPNRLSIRSEVLLQLVAAVTNCYMHRVATWIDLQTSKLADVPIDNQLQKKYISLCSEMRLCTSLSNGGENYTSMSTRSCSGAVLTATSKASLPSGNPAMMPAVCQARARRRPYRRPVTGMARSSPWCRWWSADPTAYKSMACRDSWWETRVGNFSIIPSEEDD
jgi:hypothetical protein